MNARTIQDYELLLTRIIAHLDHADDGLLTEEEAIQKVRETIDSFDQAGETQTKE